MNIIAARWRGGARLSNFAGDPANYQLPNESRKGETADLRAAREISLLWRSRYYYILVANTARERYFRRFCRWTSRSPYTAGHTVYSSFPFRKAPIEKRKQYAR